MTNVQYRDLISQEVFPTVEAWRKNARETYGERVFQQAGYTADPLPEPVIDMSDEAQRTQVERGIIEVVEGVYPGRRNPDFTEACRAAIRALYVKDADPYWVMSDDYSVRPKAELTELGKQYARDKGWLVKCADNVASNGIACKQETGAEGARARDGRCASCHGSMQHFGPPPELEGVPQLCGMCHVTYVRATTDQKSYGLPQRDRNNPYRNFFGRG